MRKTTIAIALSVTLGVLSGCGGKSPEESVAVGETMLESKNYRGAGIEFKSALQVNPELIDARIGLAKISLMSRNFSSAITELDKAKAMAEKSGKSTREINTLLARAYHNDEAGEAVLDLDAKGHPEILYYQVASLIMLNDYSKAASLVKTSSEKNAFTSLAEILVETEQQDYDLLLTRIDQISTQSDIFRSESALVKMNLAFQAKKTDLAIEAMGTYYQLNPTDTSRSLQYAHMLTSFGKFERAHEVISPLVKQFPSHGLVNEIYAMALYNTKDYEGAQSAALVANVANPKSVMSRLVSAYSAVKMEKRDDALEHLSFIEDRLASDHPAKRLYIQLKAGSGDFKGISEEALSLTELSSDDAALLSNIGLEMVRRGDVEAARKLAKQAGSTEAKGDDKVSLGLLQMSLNQKDLALQTLESAFQEAPESSLAGNSLVNAYLSSGRFAEADEMAEQWLQQGKEVEGTVLKGVVAAKQQQIPEANGFFTQALSLEPSNFIARAGIIELLVISGDIAQAKEKLKHWVPEEGMLPLFRNYMSTVRQLEIPGGVESSSELLNEWLESGLVTGNDAIYLSAQTAFLARDFKLAEKHLLSLKETEKSQQADYWLLLSNIALDKGDRKATEEAYLNWLLITPADPMPILGLVQTLAEQGKYREAGEFLDSSLPQVENKTPGHILRAHLYMKEQNWAGVRQQLSKLPAEIKVSPLGNAFQGVLLVQKKQYAKAESLLTPYVKETANDDFLRWLVASQGAQGKSQAIVDTLDGHLVKNPQSAIAHFMMGNSMVAEGKLEKAIQHYRTALPSATGNAVLQNNLAYTLWKTGNIDEAKLYAEKAVGMAPDVGPFVETYASILFDLGDKEKVVGVMDKLLKEGVNVNQAFKETYERLKSSN